MPRVNLTWYDSIVSRIMRDVCTLKQKEIAEIEGVTRQAVSKKMKGTYKKELTNWVQILDKAGYVIREKEDEKDRSIHSNNHSSSFDVF